MEEKREIRAAGTPQLQRKLGLLDTTSLVIGAVIGSGIFMTSGFIAQDLPSPGLILLAWLLGGFITISGALSFGELGAMYPEAGGQFIYLREAYGPWAGFFYGWAFFWFIMCGGIAALAVAFAEFIGYFVPFLSLQHKVLETGALGLSYSLSWGQLVAVVSILVLTYLHSFGIKEGIFVQNILTFLRIASVLVFVALGLAFGRKTGITSVRELFPPLPPSFGLFQHFGIALIAVFWTYDGWYSANCTAEEIKRPEKNIPLGLLLGTAAVTAVYFLVNLVYVLALPVEKMKGVARIGELASTTLFGPGVTFFISAAITVSIFGCLNATILYGPRVYYAMAQRGSFFGWMSYVHPRRLVPTKALYGQAVWASILCLSGTYQDLYEYVIFALLLFFAATGAAVIILRRKFPGAVRPYRAWGYPVVQLFFILACLAIFLNTVVAQPGKSLIGFAVLSAGVPAFLYWKKRPKML